MEIISPKTMMIATANPAFKIKILNVYISALVSALRPELIKTPARMILTASNTTLKDILLEIRSNLL
jgi:hypothetical protein